jgi:hypothetical protein
VRQQLFILLGESVLGIAVFGMMSRLKLGEK